MVRSVNCTWVLARVQLVAARVPWLGPGSDRVQTDYPVHSTYTFTPLIAIHRILSHLIASSGHVLILRSASRHQPGREGRKAPRTYAHTAIPADLLMGNYCEQVVHSRYIHWDSSPRAAGWSSVAGRRGRSPAVGTYEGWMTSYGVYGHLLDSLSAWGHSVTLFKPEQARFGRLYASMFFRKASPQTEGRRNADLKIKT